MDDERVHLTKQQLDELLKKWKREGAERAGEFVVIASLPLALFGGFLPKDELLFTCIVYYCAVVLLAITTI